MDVKNSRILEQYNWTVHKELCANVPEMGLPCDALGPHVFVVRNGRNQAIGFSRLCYEDAIVNAIDNRTNTLIRVEYGGTRASTIFLDRRRAFEVAQSIIGQLSNEDELISVSFMADIKEVVEP